MKAEYNICSLRREEARGRKKIRIKEKNRKDG
jgi:hypothetical protein